MKAYDESRIEWIRFANESQEWENMNAFTDAFNSHFGTNVSRRALNSAMNKRGIKLNSICNNDKLTKEQLDWIKNNLDVIEWRNQKHFTDTFNALFGKNMTAQAMNTRLYKNGWKVRTSHNTNHWTQEMDEWLAEKYPECNFDFVTLARDFNKVFGTDKESSCITKHLERSGIHTPRKKKRAVSRHGAVEPDIRPLNRGTFKRGHTRTEQLPVGTIRYNNDGRPFIKVMESSGDSGQLSGKRGHNYKEPWWKPLQKKLWEDVHGECPEGYTVCSLTGDPNDTDVKHMDIIDKRGIAVMAKKGWWSIDNVAMKRTAVMWCNLYYVAKDHGVNLANG